MKWKKKKLIRKLGQQANYNKKNGKQTLQLLFRTINTGWLKDTVIHRAFLNLLGANYKVSVCKKKF